MKLKRNNLRRRHTSDTIRVPMKRFLAHGFWFDFDHIETEYPDRNEARHGWSVLQNAVMEEFAKRPGERPWGWWLFETDIDWNCRACYAAYTSCKCERLPRHPKDSDGFRLLHAAGLITPAEFARINASDDVRLRLGIITYQQFLDLQGSN